MKSFVKLNIGGILYNTSLNNLLKSKYFVNLFGNEDDIIYDDNGNIFIDREGIYFKWILRFLRGYNNFLPSDEKELELILEEAQFFQIDELVVKSFVLLNAKIYGTLLNC